MDVFLWTGSAVGAVVGLLHGFYLYRQQSGNSGKRIIGLYYGLWTFALWTLFGSYVLAFWILGSVTYLIVRLVSVRRTA